MYTMTLYIIYDLHRIITVYTLLKKIVVFFTNQHFKIFVRFNNSYL